MDFNEQTTLNVNNDKEKEKNAQLLNNLEDLDNPIRAIFAVYKLNEGWDVLNLFDIVKVDEKKRSTKTRRMQKRNSLVGELDIIHLFMKKKNLISEDLIMNLAI